MQLFGYHVSPALAQEATLLLEISPMRMAFCVYHNDQPTALGECAWSPDRSMGENLLDTIHREPWLHLPYRQVQIMLDTDRVCLVPAALYEKSASKNLLKNNGVLKTATDKIVRCGEHEEIMGLMILCESDYLALKMTFVQSELAFTHPLKELLRNAYSRPTIALYAPGPQLHVVVSQSGQHLFAEPIPLRSEGDLLYGLKMLDHTFRLKNYQLLFSGIPAQQLRKTAARYYKHTSVENPIALPENLKGADSARYSLLIRSAYADR